MRGIGRLLTALTAFALAAATLPTGAAAQAREPFTFTLEADLALPVGTPQAGRFGAGGSVAAGLYRGLAPWLLLGARLRGALLADGDPPSDPGLADPGMGGLLSASLAARFRPLGTADDVRRGVGPFAELAAGAVLTGDLLRPGVELGVGWGLEVGPVGVAPTARYAQVIQLDDALEGNDARLLLFGVEVTLLDARPVVGPPPPPSDRDGDGLIDPEDACPDDPEDFDGFEDEDGCPESDNDRDGILDPADACPLQPEDPDGFEDEDGCPDPDNDGDGILDGDDACPNEPEVVNGVDDEDGCPDEGLIELVNDRIVLEAQVLFDTERDRIRWRAGPVLDAIVTLWRQHPEWTRVRIEGHADYRGPDRYNQGLSERRAQNVMTDLVRRGMPADMLVSEGYGSSRPRTLGDSQRSLQVNRRVEFVIIRQREVRADGTFVERDTEAAGEPGGGEEGP